MDPGEGSAIKELKSSTFSAPNVTWSQYSGAGSYIMPKALAAEMPTKLQLRRRAIACAVPMIGFGFMDNLIMIQVAPCFLLYTGTHAQS